VRILRNVYESPAAEESRGPIVDRVDDDEPRRGGVACHDCEPQGLGEQATAEPLALIASIDSKAGDQDGRDRVARHSLRVPPWGGRATDRPRSEAEVARDVGIGEREVAR
jgi:hypothetical protein